MTHPLIETLTASERARSVSSDDLDAYLQADTDGLTVIFFPGHGANKLETPDVAVVLIELIKMFPLRVGVVDEASERDLMGRCAVLMLPSISIFRGASHLKTIAKIQDWEVYAREIPALMDGAAPSEKGNADV